MMTRKHFAAIAAALQGQKPIKSGIKTPEDRAGYICAHAQWTLDCRAIADVCARENPNFDRAHFLAACRVDQ